MPPFSIGPHDSPRLCSFPVLVGALLGLWIGSGMEPAHAQLDEPVNALHRHDGPDVGVGVGLLLLKGAAEVDEGTTDRTVWRDDPESEAAGMLVLAGFAAIAAGGPIGAVEGAGMERGRWDAYAGAGFGEFVAGVLGYALAGQLHDSTPSRLVGLGAGMAVGSATGAVWVASAQAEDDGLFSYQNGRWQVSTPDVQVRPHLATPRSPSVGVTVVSARF